MRDGGPALLPFPVLLPMVGFYFQNPSKYFTRDSEVHTSRSEHWYWPRLERNPEVPDFWMGDGNSAVGFEVIDAALGQLSRMVQWAFG